jgi:hypothetical protein
MPIFDARLSDVGLDSVDPFAPPERPAAVPCHAAQTNTVEPRGELGLGTVGVQALVYDHEYILEHIVEIGAPNAHPLQREPDEALLRSVNPRKIKLGLRRG